MNAFVSVVLRAGRPRFLITIPTEGIPPEEFKRRLDEAMQTFSDLHHDTATDVGMPAGVDVKIIGAESFGQKFQLEVMQILQNYLAGVGLPPALLSLVTQASAGTESWLRQVIICLQSQFYEYQDALATAWNSSFWKVVQVVEGMPVAPQMEFEAPRLLEMLAEEQAREAKFNNDLRECKAKIRPPAWLAHQCGADSIYDVNGLTEFIESEGMTQDIGNEETNSNGQTKYTDAKATNKTTG